MAQGARAQNRNPYLRKNTIDDETLAELKAFARSLGVTDIGDTCVDPAHIFRGFRILYPNAIVFAIEMDCMVTGLASKQARSYSRLRWDLR